VYKAFRQRRGQFAREVRTSFRSRGQRIKKAQATKSCHHARQKTNAARAATDTRYTRGRIAVILWQDPRLKGRKNLATIEKEKKGKIDLYAKNNR